MELLKLVKIVPIIRKYIRVPDGTRINKQQTNIMLRDELTQMTLQKKSITDFRYPRACRIRKYQFENRSWELPLPTFFKN
jgi:hypothetical protein